jgi:drug/metabolite transporter (DMT)-like permease
MKPSTHSFLLGLLAIVCWGSLATLGNQLIHLPPFYVLGLSFIIGSIPAWTKPKELFPDLATSSWGILGYFGYHFFLFYSFRKAPIIEANLINYLWPMILVMLTPLFFKSQKLKWYHFVGAGLSLFGCLVLVRGKGAEIKLENFYGYLLALGAAISWPVYSLVKKKMRTSTVWSVGGFCLGAGILCLITHALIEPRVVLQWNDALMIFLMGIGPFGISFYAWDRALAHGDSRVIGALSYLTPVLSTLGLVIFANQTMNLNTVAAMVLIIGGASSGLLDFLTKKDLLK